MPTFALLSAFVMHLMIACAPVPGLRPEATTAQRLYSVADLLPQPPNAAPEQGAEVEGERLIRLIVQTIRPTSWYRQGGTGTIGFSPAGMVLVVDQTPEVHARIAALLEQLRAQQRAQIEVEVRIVKITDVFGDLDSMAAPKEPDFSAAEPNRAAGPSPDQDQPGVPAHSEQWDRQSYHSFLEAIQDDPRTSVTRVPQLIVGNGQVASASLTNRHFTSTAETGAQQSGPSASNVREAVETGVQLTARACLANEGRAVDLWVKIAQTEGNEADDVTSWHMEKTAVVPVGQTLLCGQVYQVRKVRHEERVPFLPWFPELGGYREVWLEAESTVTVVLVTPRVSKVQDGTENQRTGRVNVTPIDENLRMNQLMNQCFRSAPPGWIPDPENAKRQPNDRPSHQTIKRIDGGVYP